MKYQFQKATNNTKNFGVKGCNGTTSFGQKSNHTNKQPIHYALLNNNTPRNPILQK
jgi:hypothetical protein